VAANRLLLSHFPELTAAYEREVLGTESEDDGPHVVYSLVFYDFLEEVLRSEPDDGELLNRTLDFLKMLLEHPDPDYVNLAQVGVGEALEDMNLPRHVLQKLPYGLLPEQWGPP